jgi:hypothetical protein
MPQYTRLNDFMALVKAANSSYARWVRSSLSPLADLLQKQDCTPQKVKEQIGLLASTRDAQFTTKANKYKDALYFLACTYPGIDPVQTLPGNCGASVAVMYMKTELKPTLQANPFFVNPVRPICVNLGVPVEEFILGHPDLSLGVLLIHLSNCQAAMNRTYCGWKAVDHMRSVIRTAIHRNLEHAVLYLKGGARACGPLDEVLRPGRLVDCHELGNHHSGFFNDHFEAFVARHDALVVMGFDADVCVHANLFGTPDTLPDGTLPPALVNKVTVITSRPLLVTVGMVSKLEYGNSIRGT